MCRVIVDAGVGIVSEVAIAMELELRHPSDGRRRSPARHLSVARAMLAVKACFRLSSCRTHGDEKSAVARHPPLRVSSRPKRADHVLDCYHSRRRGSKLRPSYRPEDSLTFMGGTDLFAGKPDADHRRSYGRSRFAQGTSSSRHVLAREAVEDAGRWRRIIPLCPFFKAQAQRHPEWHDVVEI